MEQHGNANLLCYSGIEVDVNTERNLCKGCLLTYNTLNRNVYI